MKSRAAELMSSMFKECPYPSASDEILGGEKWGLGPTFVALRQEGHWTVGLLTNHIWSVEGD